jgi:hypothetical protein
VQQQTPNVGAQLGALQQQVANLQRERQRVVSLGARRRRALPSSSTTSTTNWPLPASSWPPSARPWARRPAAPPRRQPRSGSRYGR